MFDKYYMYYGETFNSTSYVRGKTSVILNEDPISGLTKRTSCGYEATEVPSDYTNLVFAEMRGDLMEFDCDARTSALGLVEEYAPDYWLVSDCPRTGDFNIVKRVSSEANEFTNGSFSIESPDIDNLNATTDVCMLRQQIVNEATAYYGYGENAVVVVAHYGGSASDALQLLQLTFNVKDLTPGVYRHDSDIFGQANYVQIHVESAAITEALQTSESVPALLTVGGEVTIYTVTDHSIEASYKVLVNTTGGDEAQTELSGQFAGSIPAID